MKNEMTKKDNPFFLSKKVKMLKFAQRLEASENELLKEFSEYLKVTYAGDAQIHYKKKPQLVDAEIERLIPEEYRRELDTLPEYHGDQRMLILEDFVEHIHILPKTPKSFITKGCALLGETPFDKLDFTRAFLEIYGGVEYADDGITKNRYSIVDCQGKAKKDFTITASAQKYKNVPFVVFNNCENILKDEYVLVAFKHLIEGNRTITTLNTDTNKFEDTVFKSWYILLGDKNNLQNKLAKINPSVYSSFRERASAFSCFIHIFNLNA